MAHTTERIRNEYRAMLLARRLQLVSDLRSKVEIAARPSRASDEDLARVEHDAFVSLRIGTLAYQQLRQIDAALMRLDTGDYGTCLDCGERIPEKRLAAVPWASYCRECQDRLGSPERARAAA